MTNHERIKQTFREVKAPEGFAERILTAQASPTTQNTHTRGRRRLYKSLLIAASLCLLTGLAITAIATNFFRLQDQIVPNTEVVWDISEPDGTVVERSWQSITIQGFLGSPEHAAELEWMEYLRTVFPHGYPVFGEFDLSWVPPEQYELYWVYNEEMLNTLIEILERHGLSTVGSMVTHNTWEELLDDIAFGQLFPDNSISANGTLYTCGTFWLEGSYDEYGFSFVSSRKGAFNFIPDALIGDIDDYSTWVYTNKHGTELILIQSHAASFIFIDKETAFITVSVGAGTEGNPLDPYTNLSPFSRSDLENFVDSIDFSQLK